MVLSRLLTELSRLLMELSRLLTELSGPLTCANLLPSLMKDLGCLVVGEHSGGGSCGVMMTTDATGICYRYSTCRTRMINQRGENIDGGIEPHVTIDTIDKMYDVEYLGRIIDQYYR